MRDQATELRHLVLHTMRQRGVQAGPPPRIVAVAGGRRGVGVTTIAVHLSAAIALQGMRVVLADADLKHPQLASRCGIAARGRLSDVLAARRDLHEILLPGPLGVQVAPETAVPREDRLWTPSRSQRLFNQLALLGRHADLVMLDVGDRRDDDLLRLGPGEYDAVFVVTHEPDDITEAYARIKSFAADNSKAALYLVVNRVSDAQLASDVHRRIDDSCQKFLGCRVAYLGWLADDSRWRPPFTALRSAAIAARADAPDMEQLALNLLMAGRATAPSRVA